MAQKSDQYLQLNEDGTPRRKHDIEEQAERRPFFFSFGGFVFFSALAMMKNIWFGEDDLRTQEPARSGPRFSELPQSGIVLDGDTLAAAPSTEPADHEQAEPDDAGSPGHAGYVHGSSLTFSLSPLDLNFSDTGAISTSKLGPPLAPPVNDNIRLYGAAPGAPIILPDEMRGGGSLGEGIAPAARTAGDNGVTEGSTGVQPDGGTAGPIVSSGGLGGTPGGSTGSGGTTGATGNGSSAGAGSNGSSGSGGTTGSNSDPRQTNRLPTVSNVVVLSTLMINEARSLELGDLLAQASDTDGDVLQVTNLKASVGHVVATSSGGWLYVPQFNDTSVVELTYEITDGEGYVVQKAYLPIAAGPHAPLNGTDGDDTLTVGPIDSVIAGIVDAGDGNDTITTGAGDDIVYGGAGDDVIRTGDGDDVVFAGDGDDIVEAGIGDDIIHGEGGDDILRGEAGNDKIYGGDGDDHIDGGDGNDTVVGGAGSDTVDGGAGDDLIVGQSNDGDDLVTGGSGDDTYVASAADGEDLISGGEGNDTYYAATGDGDDTFVGDAGNDTYVAAAGDGNDTVIGGDGDDTFESAANDGQDLFEGMAGHDVFVAVSAGDGDTFDGGDGSDTYDASAFESAIIVDLTAGTVTLLQASDDAPLIEATAFADTSEPAAAEPTDAGEQSPPVTAGATEPLMTLISVESVIGGSGNDQFIANDEQNEFTGGSGEDLFVFQTVASAGYGSGGRDKILDFEVGDRIKIDDISEEFEDEFNQTFDDPGIRKFVLISQAQDFSRPGEVRFKYDEETNTTILEGNVDYDAETEFEIEILGVHDLKYDSYVYST